MKSGTISALVVTGLLVLGAGLFVLSGSNDTDNNRTAPTSSSDQASQTSTPVQGPSDSNDQLLKASEVAENNTADSCWTIINGVVYDITEYIPRHPGGSEILRTCGVEGTSLFTQRKTEDGDKVGSGTPHSSRASGQLDDYRIGTLDETEE